MKKIFSAILLSSFLVSGIAFAKDSDTNERTGNSEVTSTASTTPSLGQQVSAVNKDAETQIRALQKELESKIKALQDEYAQKIREVRSNAQDQIKTLQGATTSTIRQDNGENEERGRERNTSSTSSPNRGRVMDFFFRLFRRGE